MQLLLDAEPAPAEPVPWPADLTAGMYDCPSDPSTLCPLHLSRWAGQPGLSTEGASGYVRASQVVQQGVHTLWRWQVEWDDGSGTLRAQTLWLQVHSTSAFSLIDAQGLARDYVLQQADVDELRFWPAPLEAGHYRAQDTAPEGMEQLELLEVVDDAGLQTPSGITCLTQMQTLADGGIQANTQWFFYDDRAPEPESRITLHIADARHFTLTTAQGLRTRYRRVD